MADPHSSRRRFFRVGLKAIFDRVDDTTRRIQGALPKVGAKLSGKTPPPRPRLRPPGALREVEFAATCERSGRCVAACPVQALRPSSDGTPHLVPSQRACVVCDDLSCMKACPSGALVLVPKEAIRIGLAEVDPTLCVRSRGEDCRACVDLCPLGSRAIVLDARGRVEVKSPGCVGCGVCELHCPTTPRAITIRPTSAW
jgi:ferredoxin-type protein NapG